MTERNDSRIRCPTPITDGVGGAGRKRHPDGQWATARRMAEQMCLGFRHHDDGNRAAAVEAFAFVDARQFPGISAADAHEAAEAYVDALWAKDTVEKHNLDDAGAIDPERIGAADWSQVRNALRRRAGAAGVSERYAELTTLAWRNHKAGGDYWTPFMRAQQVELAAVFGDTSLPRKRSDGRSGYGVLPTRYVLGVELHDRHTAAAWREAVDVMTPYYAEILAAHER